MLVLSRKRGQSIVIDGQIVVSVVDVGRGRVQIGVTAPREMPVYREELQQRLRDEAGLTIDRDALEFQRLP